MTPFIAITPADWALIEAGHEWLGLGDFDFTPWTAAPDRPTIGQLDIGALEEETNDN